MSTHYFPAVFHKGNSKEKGYCVEFPDLSGCFSQGESIEEAFKSFIEALELYLDQNKENFKASSVEKVLHDFPNEIVKLALFLPVSNKEDVVIKHFKIFI